MEKIIDRAIALSMSFHYSGTPKDRISDISVRLFYETNKEN